MNLSRRMFNGHLVKGALAFPVLRVAGVGAGALLMEGCDPVQELLNFAPIAEDAINSIQTLLTANGFVFSAPILLALAVAKAALVDLKGAAVEYLAVTPPPQGALQKVEAAVKAVVDNFGDFLSSLGLPGGNLLSTIAGIIQFVLSTIAGFMTKEPQLAQVAKARLTAVYSRSANGSTTVLPIVPHKRSHASFKSGYNEILESGAKAGLNCPATVYMHISIAEHLHL